MTVISGGNIINPTAMPDVKARIVWIENFAGGAVAGADPLVQSSSTRVPVNGDLAGNPVNGNIYERQGGTTWARIDTI